MNPPGVGQSWLTEWVSFRWPFRPDVQMSRTAVTKRLVALRVRESTSEVSHSRDDTSSASKIQVES